MLAAHSLVQQWKPVLRFPCSQSDVMGRCWIRTPAASPHPPPFHQVFFTVWCRWTFLVTVFLQNTEKQQNNVQTDKGFLYSCKSWSLQTHPSENMSDRTFSSNEEPNSACCILISLTFSSRPRSPTQIVLSWQWAVHHCRHHHQWTDICDLWPLENYSTFQVFILDSFFLCGGKCSQQSAKWFQS